MTTLIIARHGNTFTSDQTPTRVGGRTNLPLVESGEAQARKLGAWLKAQSLFPEITYCSTLIRTQDTAKIALKELGYPQPIYPLEIFNEIDYGVDENQTEDVVIARIGAAAIKDWDERAIVPDGWQFNPDACIENWKNFAKQHTPAPITSQRTLGAKTDKIPDQIWDVAEGHIHEEIVLVVTSNGIARFAPHLAGNYEEFANNNQIKLSTGALGILKYEDTQWRVTDWNVKP